MGNFAYYTGEHERVSRELRKETSLAFIGLVFGGGEDLLGADAHQGAFSYTASLALGSEDPLARGEFLQKLPEGAYNSDFDDISWEQDFKALEAIRRDVEGWGHGGSDQELSD